MPCINEVNGVNEFLELGHHWNQVLNRCKDKNVFLTWEYLSTCWKHFGYGKKLKTLIIKDRTEIIAIAPLRQSRYSFENLFGYNVIEPLGYRGRLEGADYTGLLLAEREAENLTLLMNYLAEQDDWDFAYLLDVPGTSLIPELLPKIAKNIRLTFDSKHGAICPYRSIPTSVDILMKELNGRFRKNLRRCMKNLQKDYRRVEFLMYEDLGSVESAMRIFFKLHQRRWKSRQKPGVFNTSQIQDFYIDVAKQFANNGWLAMYFLIVDEEPVAAIYNYLYDQKMYFALGGFDPDYSRYSVGHLLLQRAIEDCILKKTKEYDFLKGDEPYKFAWAKEYRRNSGFRFVNNKPMSRLYDLGARVVKQTRVDGILGRSLHF